MSKVNPKILWILVLIPVILAWIAGLFIDVTGDSGLYSAIVRQMVDSGDWFNLNYAGIPYKQKPHLFFWLAAMGVHLFGNYNFAFKLFPFIYGLGGIYFTYRLGKLLFSEQAGRLAALFVATSQIYFLYFFDLHTDTVLQTGVMLALWQLAEYLKNAKWFNFCMAFSGVGLAMLSKGPFGAVLPFFAVIFYLLANKDYKQLFHPKWLLGILISLSVILPTLYHLYKSFGKEGIKFFFIENNVGRITGSLTGTNNDFTFYLHTLLWTFIPWTPIVVPAIFLTVKSWFQKNTEKVWSLYLLGGTLILTAVLSWSKGKAPNYFLISIAPIALVSAWWVVSSVMNSEDKLNRIKRSQTIVAVFQGISFLATVFILSAINSIVPLLLIVLGALISLLVVINKNFKSEKFLLFNILIAGIFNLFINVSVIPELFSYQGARQVLEKFEKNESKDKTLYNFDMIDYNLFFYAKEKVKQIDSWEMLDKTAKMPESWIYTNERKYNEIKEMGFNIDTAYYIEQWRMNKISLQFLFPKTRQKSLTRSYLIVTGHNENN